MSGSDAYLSWEVGLGHAAPQPLADAMKPQERLLWCVALPSSRLTPRHQSGVALSLGLGLLFVLNAPFGQSMSEYCAESNSQKCEMLYFLWWPTVGMCAWSTAHLLYLIWKSRVAPWRYFYGVSTDRAIRIDGNKPDNLHSTRLERKSARIDWFGDVRFDRSRTGFSFSGLDDREAIRAVFWANEGRFRPEFQSKATP